MIAVNTPYFIGSICAIILNLVIPTDLVDDTDVEIEETWQTEEEEGLTNNETTGVVPEEKEKDLEADMTEKEETITANPPKKSSEEAADDEAHQEVEA